jgi:hypothetical protein
MIRRIDLDQQRSRSRNDFDRWGQRKSRSAIQAASLTGSIFCASVKGRHTSIAQGMVAVTPKTHATKWTVVVGLDHHIVRRFPEQVAAEAARAIFMFGVAARRMSFRRLRRGKARIWTGSPQRFGS